MLSIIAVTSFDVLSGRDKQAFGHEGNNYFRDLVQIHREAYQGSRRRADKNAITKKVIGLVREREGRFLKLGDTGLWAEMSDEMVYEKVSHALRGAKSPTSAKSSSAKKTSASAAASAAARRSAPSQDAALGQLGRVMGIQKAIFERLVRDGREASVEAVNVVSDSSLCGDDEDDSHAEDRWRGSLPPRPQAPMMEEEDTHYIPEDIWFGNISDPDPADFQLLSSESLAFDIPSIGV